MLIRKYEEEINNLREELSIYRDDINRTRENKVDRVTEDTYGRPSLGQMYIVDAAGLRVDNSPTRVRLDHSPTRIRI